MGGGIDIDTCLVSRWTIMWGTSRSWVWSTHHITLTCLHDNRGKVEAREMKNQHSAQAIHPTRCPRDHALGISLPNSQRHGTASQRAESHGAGVSFAIDGTHYSLATMVTIRVRAVYLPCSPSLIGDFHESRISLFHVPGTKESISPSCLASTQPTSRHAARMENSDVVKHESLFS